MLDQRMVTERAALMSEDERLIRIDGGFGYRASRCAFTEFALKRQETYTKTAKTYYLHGATAPRSTGHEWETYFSGETRFPGKCALDATDRQILIRDRMDSGRQGVSCYDCQKLCPFFQPPPVIKRPQSLGPSLQDMPGCGEDTPRIRVYELPKPGKLYIAGIDSAKGVKGGDHSVMAIADAVTGEEVAELHCQLKPRDFAYAVAGLYLLYNQCFLVPEENGPGAEIISILTDELGIQNVFADPERKRSLPDGSTVPFVGFLTTQSSKRERLVRALGQMMETGELKIRNSETLNELRNFVREAKELRAMTGAHDDRVIAWCLIAVGWSVVSREAALNPTVPGVQFPDGSAAELDRRWEEKNKHKLRGEEYVDDDVINFDNSVAS